MVDITTDTANSNQRADRTYALERNIRLWSGVILFVFVAMHLLNAAVGIAGVDLMERVQLYRVAIWQTWIGTALLYGAGAVHLLLGLKRIVSRRTWRMPFQEALQIALGLAIPVLLYEHVIGNRYVQEFAGVNTDYSSTLSILWPDKAFVQILLLLVVWVHGIVGLHYVLRTRNWFLRWRGLLLSIAVAIPFMAIAGFISAGREVAEYGAHNVADWTPEQVAAALSAIGIASTVIFVGAIALVVIIVALALLRRFGRNARIRYVGHGSIKLPRGSTLLEGSRGAGIPHQALCGGRARCASCRVLVVEGEDSLAPPGPAEAKILKRISAPARVRLACQIRPDRDLAVQLLLPVETREGGNVEWTDDAMKWGAERTATVLFVDLRGFTNLTKSQLPHDLILLLNRFIGEMRQAIEGHSGRVTTVLTDGMMAVFGLKGERGYGSRGAIAAAEDMLRTVDTLNDEYRAALSMPLRIGIGIHTGPIVIGRVGDDEHGYEMSVLGETVTIASRLETATKEALSDCLVSEATVEATRRSSTKSYGVRREINLPGLGISIGAYGLDPGKVVDQPAADDEDSDEPAEEVTTPA